MLRHIAFVRKGKYNRICKTKARESSERSLKVKLTINENTELSEDEIIINCAYMDERMKNLVNYVRQYTFSLEGESEGKMYHVPLDTIYYIDTVDGKTFLYDREYAYCSRLTLTALEEKLFNTSFVRISKNCLMNVAYLKCVEPYVNHRMQAELKNGEKLLISRNYIESLKQKLRR